MSDPRNANPVGFWQIPPDVWTDDERLEDFVQRVSDHMTTVGDRDERDSQGEQSQERS